MHQVVLPFDYESVTFQFDNWLNDEIKLPLNSTRIVENLYIVSTVLSIAHNHQECLKDLFFKVKLEDYGTIRCLCFRCN